jgi:hypothetical protein
MMIVPFARAVDKYWTLCLSGSRQWVSNLAKFVALPPLRPNQHSRPSAHAATLRITPR